MDAAVRSPGPERFSGRWELAQQIFAIAAALFIGYSVFVDYSTNGFGTNNMRVVSFVDSLWHCYCFRSRAVNYFTEEEDTSPNKPPRSRRAHSVFVYTSTKKDLLQSSWILTRAFFIKFMGGTVVSLAFGQTPVWLKGIRHMTSFLVALTIIQGLPSFLPIGPLYNLSYKTSAFLVATIRRSAILRGAIRFSGSLYKMRKIGFLTAACIGSNYSWVVLVLLAVWVVECSAVLMSVDAKIEGHHPVKSALTSTLFSSRWRVSACAALFLVLEWMIIGPENSLSKTPWQWHSPFKIFAFALLVVRNFGGFTSVKGYPVLSAVATPCISQEPATPVIGSLPDTIFKAHQAATKSHGDHGDTTPVAETTEPQREQDSSSTVRKRR